MILLIFATELEAAPFIDYHRLRPLKGHLLHPLYEGDGLSLTISGMGFLRGALALSQTLEMQQERGDPVTRVLNYGIAGSLTDRFSLGDAVGVHKVMKYNPVEFARPRFNKHFASAFPEITVDEQGDDMVVLATSDHPVMTEEDARCAARYAQLVDMEGYGYAFVAGNYGVPIRLIKGISDFARKESEALFSKQVKKAIDSLLSYHASRLNGAE